MEDGFKNICESGLNSTGSRSKLVNRSYEQDNDSSSSSSSSSSSFTGFYNPLAGFSLLILEVSRSHTMT
jgi:hypothetical protein